MIGVCAERGRWRMYMNAYEEMIRKTATPHLSSPPQVGDTIGYTIAATNDGNVTLHDVSITDPLLPVLS